eukprot:TRINITY_DN20799_c0_g1_i1.p1 TRINITY_DN20799_c0_g1~~TRINITY_DN20799_c0_g1_i1.p1  ORF type:complete len:353 (-),score=26.32 TRINITY_DN20799_c0_g1_i1:81-1118(-)
MAAVENLLGGADAHQAAGDKAFQEGRYLGAIEMYSKALELKPTDANLYLLRCRAYSYCGRHKEALKDTDKCIQLCPTKLDYYYEKLTVAIADDDIYSAIHTCHRGLEKFPGDARFQDTQNTLKPRIAAEVDKLKALGNQHFQSGENNEAIAWYSKAIYLAPNNHVLYSNRSACWCNVKNYDKALKDANKCIKLNKEWPKGYGRKAAALHGQGKKQEALAIYRLGLKVDPYNTQLKTALTALEDTIHGAAPVIEKRPQAVVLCMYCRQPGHVQRDCPVRIEQQQREREIRNPKRQKKSADPDVFEVFNPKTMICRGCGQTGHSLRDCPTPSTPIDYFNMPQPGSGQ